MRLSCPAFLTTTTVITSSSSSCAASSSSSATTAASLLFQHRYPLSSTSSLSLFHTSKRSIVTSQQRTTAIVTNGTTTTTTTTRCYSTRSICALTSSSSSVTPSSLLLGNNTSPTTNSSIHRRGSYCSSSITLTTFHNQQHLSCNNRTSKQQQHRRTMTTEEPKSSSSGDEMMKSLLLYKQQQLQSPNYQLIGNHIAHSIESLINADCVCFDVDSTVIQEEGIDVLADYFNKGSAVAQLTKRAMEGGLKFEDALSERLSLLQPSKLQIESCLRDRPFRLTPGIKELIKLLHQSNIDVYFISGGFRIMIEPIAKQLNINPETNVIANTILFDSDLFYNGFDTTEYTSRDMGKPAAIQSLYDQHPKYQKIVMIGDGMTDAQSKPPATTFIGFGGVIVRPKVQEMADWYITDFQDLAYLLQTFRK